MKADYPRRGNLSPARLTGCAFALMLVLVLIASPRDTGWTASSAARAAAGAGVARAQSSLKGQFGPVMSWGAQPVMIHASVLPDGRVLFWGRDKVTSGGGGLTKLDVVGRSMARVWNPSNNTFETVDNFTTNLFCSGHSLLPDGRLFAAGGHAHPHQYSRSGDAHTNIFDPVTRQWSNGPNMEKGRWYPFTVALDTGEVAIVGRIGASDRHRSSTTCRT